MEKQQQEEEPLSLNSDLKKQETVLCEECKEKPSKYKCPGCSVRSCSLDCVKAHKQRASCSGKRSQTHFVPLSQFDDNVLLSDYNLLEEIKRVADSARRTRTKLHPHPPYSRFPPHRQDLKRAAARRRTKLLFLPSGMSKREKNQTQYDPRKKSISWTIEWRFHSTDVVLHDHGVHEDTELFSVIEKHLKPGPWNHPLRQFCDQPLDSLKFFIRKYPKGPKSTFCEINTKASLRQQLANVVILEHPVIHVFLPSHKYDFDVVKDVCLVNHRLDAKNSASNDCPSPKGIVFREEQIEDEANICSSDPQVYDLLKNEILSPSNQICHHNASVKALENIFDDSLAVREAAANGVHSSSKSEGTFENMEFDFDQGLMDAYSDLIAQINPDDFLDLEGVFSKEEEERNDHFGSMETFSVEEELEEGEIAE
ncbi:box C/D snoRNA protein [Populus alba x Populus x berolinensis]|nr:box C/D snoRNA protein [Populus alba x Populus x berolinensis]